MKVVCQQTYAKDGHVTVVSCIMSAFPVAKSRP